MPGKGQGQGGRGQNRSGMGRGAGGGRGMGPGGECQCSNCGKKVPHERGIPCFEQKCPDCDTPMTRV
ncbi:hypothetical protein ACFL2O_03365 [Thermodesulfobacteriota bacterium]